MGDSKNPIGITIAGDWSKPANTLIEKCAAAVSGIFRPAQIRRVAHAEADAEKIRAITQIEVTELQRRALIRFVSEEAQKQLNIETILTKALPDVKEDAHPERMDNDWIANFFDKCRLISDDEMQTLWAKVLAGEANAPGSFSKRTVILVGSMDKDDAATFSTLCRFAFIVAGDTTPLIFETTNSIYNQKRNFLRHATTLG